MLINHKYKKFQITIKKRYNYSLFIILHIKVTNLNSCLNILTKIPQFSVKKMQSH